MSKECERFEVLVSTFLDEGLERWRQQELLDHLTRCPGCSRFYRAARALDGLVAVVAPRTGLEKAPAAIWKTIERRARSRPAAPRRLLPWVLAAAAALLVGIGLPLLPWPGPSPVVANGAIEIQLEENRDAMSETRFLELTTELLQADRKYHFAMQDVMEAVIRGSWEGEGATSEDDRNEATDDDEKRGARIRT